MNAFHLDALCFSNTNCMCLPLDSYYPSFFSKYQKKDKIDSYSFPFLPSDASGATPK